MNPTPARPAGANIAIPSTIWLAPATARSSASAATPDVDTVVPDWALRRIRTEFTHRPGHHTPAPLLHMAIPGTGDGMDARAHHQPADTDPPQVSGPPVLLAELHPEATRTLHKPGDNSGRGVEGLAGFFHRAYRLLRTGGLLLTASRQAHREDGELLDPCGQLTTSARAAGFVYRQHILLVHATASGNRLHPTPDAPAEPSGPFWRHRPIHSDLLLFTA